MSNSWVVNEFLAPDSVALGRLVLSAENPEQDYFTPDASILPTSENIAQVQYNSFEETLGKAQGTKLAALLTKLLTLNHKGSKSHSSVIKAATCITYTLKNSGGYFTKLCEDVAARNWLNNVLLRNGDIYLIVGVRTLTDAKVVLKDDSQRDTDVDAKVPLDVVLPAAGVPVPPGLLGDVGGSGGKSSSASIHSQFEARGEQVYAAQFRKLKFSFLAKKTVDNALLAEGNSWIVYSSERRVPRSGLPKVHEDEDSHSDRKSPTTEKAAPESKIVTVTLTDSTVDMELQNEAERSEVGDDVFVFLESETQTG